MDFQSYIVTKIIDLLSPPACAYCDTTLSSRTPLCSLCVARIKPTVSMSIPLTPTVTMPVYAVGAYQDPLRSLILAKNFGNRAVSKQLGNLMWQTIAPRQLVFDYVVPIPLHWTRYARRGYNQAEVMAHELARLSGKQVSCTLRRIRRTAFQAGLNVIDRTVNVHAAFKLGINAQELHGKNIILIDDLTTTGSTLKEAGKLLLHAQPASIAAIVVCRVV
jgi:ComF family protein